MSALCLSAAIVGFCACGVALLGNLSPEALLKIPNYGFIPWALTGNPMPPYLHSNTWTAGNAGRFLKEDDIVMAYGARSGGMWLATMMHLIRTSGDDNYKNLFDHLGLMETVKYPGEDFEKRIRVEKAKLTKHPKDKPRIWLAQSAPSARYAGLNPKQNPKIKYVCIVRDGKEVAQGLMPLYDAHTEEFRNLWGGFPPPLKGTGAAVKFLVEDAPPFYFGFTASWWVHRHEPNMFLVHFNDVKRDPQGCVRRLAAFMGVKLSDEELGLVAERSSKAHMAKTPERHRLMSGQPDQRVPVLNFTYLPDGNYPDLSDEMKVKWTSAVLSYFNATVYPGLAEWAAHGGGYES